MERLNGAIALPAGAAETNPAVAYDLDGECATVERSGTELAVRESESGSFVPVYPGAKVGPTDAFSAAGNFSLAVGPVWPEDL